MGRNVPCDTDTRTPHRSLGSATAKERVYEKANHSFQREGQLQELSGRHVEVKGFANETTQYDLTSPIRHRNPAIQETRIATGSTPSYFTPRTVPVGNVPSIGYPMRQDDNWSILSNATSTKLPQSNNGNQTFMFGDSSKNDGHTPFPACSDRSTPISLSDSSKQFFHVDKQVSEIRGCLQDTGVTFAPERVHSGSLSWLHICLRDTTTKRHAGESHPGVSSPRLLYRCENFTPVRNLATVSCKRETTTRFGVKSVCRWTGAGSACVAFAILNHTYILLT